MNARPRRQPSVDPAGDEPCRDHIDALLVAAGRGDRAAFAAFYDRTAPTVFGMLRRVLDQRTRAEQVTEHVYLQLWQCAPTFDPSHRSAYATALLAARRALAGPVHDRVTAGPGPTP